MCSVFDTCQVITKIFTSALEAFASPMDVDDDEKDKEEDAAMRKFRLNLLALSKRAPLEKVARLPAELVPMHIRHVIPTIESAP